jgi:hypothetical protein
MMGAYPLGSPLGWACVSDPLEVVPYNDTHKHTTGADCACRPEIDDFGAIVHNAWDNREAFIEGRRKPH